MSRRIVRFQEGLRRIPVGRTKFRQDYIDTGRLRLVPLGRRAVGLVEDELAQVVDEVIAERDDAAVAATLKRERTPRTTKQHAKT